MATLVPTPSVLVASTGRAIRAIALASNIPAKPPSPPSTSGRVARRTLAFMSSTALSPASTSTPAAAYVMGVGSWGSVTPGSLPAARDARAGRPPHTIATSAEVAAPATASALAAGSPGVRGRG